MTLAARQATRDLLTLRLRQAPHGAPTPRRLDPAGPGDIATHVLGPGAELARHPPQRRTRAPQLPHPLLLALREPEPSHRDDHLHQPGQPKQAARTFRWCADPVIPPGFARRLDRVALRHKSTNRPPYASFRGSSRLRACRRVRTGASFWARRRSRVPRPRAKCLPLIGAAHHLGRQRNGQASGAIVRSAPAGKTLEVNARSEASIRVAKARAPARAGALARYTDEAGVRYFTTISFACIQG
jgi:hypothetical protein